MKEEGRIHGKCFSLTEPQNTNTVIYKIDKTEKENLKKYPKYTVERLEHKEEFTGKHKKKTFFIDEPSPMGNPLVILSFSKERVVVNVGFLDEDTVKISKKPIPMKFRTLYYEEDTVFKEFSYTPNMKRPISIIDIETTEEVKPTLYLDEETNEIRGKCTLKANKEYFAFEIKDNK